ncbi:sigma-54-dependent transcriptional regulator [Geopsychrobacter electrodiphilus]|uniref:sigma-54-dependent transcriptional regulator n=1 Tax=Geopsychrobacter electrodiphilus TaxID=225196 RepID=UPI00036D789F|nr:sigma-54 dependent transcriptional regulator [Geopsychrobacter electrodiphilus]
MLNFSNQNPHIVLVDDESSELEAYRFLLNSMGVQQITTVQDSRQVLAKLVDIVAPIVFLDLNMPHLSGQQVLQRIKEQLPQVPVIICTANSEIETAVECLKLGAHDYLVKPINLNTFGSALRTALEINSLRAEVMSLKGISFGSQGSRNRAFDQIVTRSPLLEEIFQYIEAIAPSGQPVLILGETGSGKELLSRAIHEVSGLPGEFVAVDVSGLDDALFSDTLFGHEKGAYTGAGGVRSGLLEKARGGTIFLDEIGDLHEVSQMKLLRLLQEGIYYPLGSDQPKRCQARIVTATNKSQVGLSGQEGNFRRDLYYRLSTHLIKVPPLRERCEDIPLLTESLVAEAAESMRKETPRINPEVIQLLNNYLFPGNVRELKTYLYDAVARCTSGELTRQLIAERLNGAGSVWKPEQTSGNLLENLFGEFPTLERLIEYAIDQALDATGKNQSRAAKLLGISKQALNKRLKNRRTAK